MKILYAIQGTGNGHLSRARDIVPILEKKGQLDILISGIQADVAFPYPITYKLGGLSFIFGKSGGVDLMRTFLKANTRKLFKDVKNLPVDEYDVIINDFEPVSAWACQLRDMPCISLSHQAAVIAPRSPKPKKTDVMGKLVLKNYAPSTDHFGFHFDRYDSTIFTPVIRKQIRQLQPENKGHYTVYLPSYDDTRIIKVLSRFKGVKWEVFSKHNKRPLRIENLHIKPVDNDAFIESMTTCTGMLCGAGFETPAEALYLQKKLMVIPMKGQYEQHCNAAALEKMGVPVLKKLHLKYEDKIMDWLDSSKVIPVDYPDETEQIIDKLLEKHGRLVH